MIQTYQGYFQEDGRFITDNKSIQIPTRRRTIINVLDDEVTETINLESQKQKEALAQLYQGLAKIDDEPLDDEYAF